MRYLLLVLCLFLFGCSTSVDCSKFTDSMTDKELEYCAKVLSHRQHNKWLIEQSKK